MTRFTLGNAVKVGLVVLFLPLLAYLVLVIGAVKKHLRVALEGLVYAGAFSVGLVALDVLGLGGLLALVSMGASGVRAYHLRDLWLPARRRWWRRMVEFRMPTQAEPPTALAEQPDDLSAALAWVGAHAQQHRRRLPTQAYVTVLQTCEVLDAVVAAERRDPSGDARLEYELDAIVREYLPAVVRGYLAIPPSMVDVRQPNGRTPDQELAEQLQLLAGQAEALHVARLSRTSAQLTTTGNFLRDKFGHRHASAIR